MSKRERRGRPKYSGDIIRWLVESKTGEQLWGMTKQRAATFQRVGRRHGIKVQMFSFDGIYCIKIISKQRGKIKFRRLSPLV